MASVSLVCWLGASGFSRERLAVLRDEEAARLVEPLVEPRQTIARVTAAAAAAGGGPVPKPSFSPGDKESFQLRTVGYKKHGRKAASAAPLYELIALDVFKTGVR